MYMHLKLILEVLKVYNSYFYVKKLCSFLKVRVNHFDLKDFSMSFVSSSKARNTPFTEI